MRAILWGAVSSKKQAADDKVSIPRQLELGREHAQRWGMTVVGELVIPGVSRSISLYDRAAKRVDGYHVDRHGNRTEVKVYAKLLELLELPADHPDRFDVLIFLDRSRLGRKASLSMTVIEICEENGVKAYDIENPPRSLDISEASQDERLIGAWSSVRAQGDLVKFAKHRLEGMQRRVENGYFGTRVPFGYIPQYNAKKEVSYIIDEEKMQTILLIQSLYLDEGLGVKKVQEQINALGRKNAGGKKPWTWQNIAWILDQSYVYAGFVEWNKTQGGEFLRVPGRQPAIITEERARAILQERSARAESRKSTGREYRFARMIRCAVCGGSCHTEAGQRGKYYYEAYHCPRHGGVSMRNAAKWLEKFFIALDDLAYRKKLIGDDATDPRPAIQDKIELYRRRIKDVEDKLRIAENLLFDGDISVERYRTRKAEFDKEIEDARAAISRAEEELRAVMHHGQRAERVNEIADKGLAMLKSQNITAANAWLRRFIRLYAAHGKITRADLL